MQENKSQNAILVISRLKSATKNNSDIELSSSLGIKANTLSTWKKRGIADYDLIFAYCHKEGINIDWLITGKGSPHEVKKFRLKTDNNIPEQSIPVYDIEATAGLVTLFDNNKQVKPIEHLSIPRLPKCDGAVYITGDSMYPLLKSGDIVVYKQLNDLQKDNIFWGEMYLVSIITDDDEFTTVKYIQKSDRGDDFVKLVSYNKHHQDKDIHLSSIKAMALVKASVRFNSMS